MPGQNKPNEEKPTLAMMIDDSSGLAKVDEKAHFTASIENLKAAKEAWANEKYTLAITIANKVFQENSSINSEDPQKRSLLALVNIFLYKVYFEQEKFDLASGHLATYLFLIGKESKFLEQYKQLRNIVFEKGSSNFEIDPREAYKLWEYCYDSAQYTRLLEISAFAIGVDLHKYNIQRSDINYGLGIAKKVLYLESGNIEQAKSALGYFFNCREHYLHTGQATHTIFDCEQQIIEICASDRDIASLLKAENRELDRKIRGHYTPRLEITEFSARDYEFIENAIYNYYFRALCHKLLGDIKMAFNDYTHAAELAYTYSCAAELQYISKGWGDVKSHYSYCYWTMFSKHCEKYLNLLVHELKLESRDVYNLTRVVPRIAFTRINNDNTLKYSVLPLMPSIVSFANATDRNQIDPRLLNSSPIHVANEFKITPDVFAKPEVIAATMLSINTAEFAVVEAERIKILNEAVAAFLNDDLTGAIKIANDLIAAMNVKKPTRGVTKGAVSEYKGESSLPMLTENISNAQLLEKDLVLRNRFSTAMTNVFARQILSRAYFLQDKLDQAAYECAEYLSLCQDDVIKASLNELSRYIFGNGIDNIIQLIWRTDDFIKLADHCLGAGCYNQALTLYNAIAMDPQSRIDLAEITYKRGLCYKGLYFLNQDNSLAHKALDCFFSIKDFYRRLSYLVFTVEGDITDIIKSNKFLEDYLSTRIKDLDDNIYYYDRGIILDSCPTKLGGDLQNFSRLYFRAMCHKLLGNFKEAYSDYARIAESALTNAITLQDKAAPGNSDIANNIALLRAICQEKGITAIRGLQQTKSDVFNWSRMSVVTAFARGNKDSAMRDSVLALIPTITRFADSDHYAVDELQLVLKLTTLTPK